MVYEWNVLRVVACLCVVLLHATTNTEIINGYIENHYYQFFRLLLCFATPTFIMLAMIILANRYQTGLSNHFLISRLKFIYVPFLFISFVYAINMSLHNDYMGFTEILYRNIVFGDFVGWFVLTIMQLYILFFFLQKSRLSMLWLAPIMMATGLLFLTFTNLAFRIVLENEGFFRMFFLGWLPYFTIAYFIGFYYQTIAQYLVNYKYATIFFVIISVVIVYINFMFVDDAIHSRRMDMILLVLAMTLFLLAFGQTLPRFTIVNLLSRYSFGIFLIHWLVQEYIAPYTALLPTTFLQVLALFSFSLISCIAIIKMISFLPFSEYLIGKAHK